ncbi:expressed protein isoform B [Micractinium conductrix]|uniref:Expressed protein isoform B n=1 Tax=Micractinium conductrix TaxID=554055 RepID=A0A2P6VH68_9CHLO|nr:expressed protein isoform B [Micractinium conductrix]|eukprot:PSC73433.1 expressed protein isoform B [Micractinium conductrix]
MEPHNEDWELVSSSSEGGDDEGRGLEEEAAALAAAFSLGEQGLPLAAAEAAPGTSPPRAAVGEPAPGSPQHLQLLHVLAAPLPPAAASAATQPHSTPAPSAGGHAELPSGPAGERRAAGDPLCLRVVRSDEQAALEAAVAALEARASERERELAVAQARVAGGQAQLTAQTHDAFCLRRLAIMATSFCAFLGLKALLGCPAAQHGSSSAAAKAAAANPTATAHNQPALPPCKGKALAPAELERQVAVLVEPLLPLAAARPRACH